MANRRVFRRAVQRRPTFWEGGTINISVGTGALGFATLVSEANLETVPKATLVRIRGSLFIRVTVGAAASQTSFTMGIKTATATAVAAGAGSIESPFVDVGSDWLWWSSRDMRVISTGTVDTDSDAIGQQFTRVEIDSKAMRVMDINRVLIFVAQNTVIGGTQTIAVNGILRILFKR